MNIIDTYLDKPWKWDWISRNPNLTIEIIEKYPDKPWNMYWISSNNNITIDIINKFNTKELDWSGISRNSNLTIEIINKYPNKKWDWFWISSNKFKWKDNILYYIQRKKQTIQQTSVYKEKLLEYTWHPNRFKKLCLDIEEYKLIKSRWKNF